MGILIGTRHLTLRLRKFQHQAEGFTKRLLFSGSNKVSSPVPLRNSKYATKIGVSCVIGAGGAATGFAVGYSGVGVRLPFWENFTVLAEARDKDLSFSWNDSKPKVNLATEGNDGDDEECRRRPLLEETVEGEAIAEADLLAADSKSKPGDKKDENDHFDWAQFAEILAPSWKRLLVACLSAFAVAYINIEIPVGLGKVVDAVSAQLTAMGQTAPGEVSAEFLSQLKKPALRLIMLYLAQAVATFNYIYHLSVIGETMAETLRSRLFASLLNQKVEFFDSHMTGDVVSRLTTDIQEFKSGFKQCVGQGLRSVSQTLGSIISLYFVSKEMTLTVIVVVPAIIGLGSLFTRRLRSLSKEAHAQVSESSGHAGETLGNIRTVKAFAMEDLELLRYNEEIEKLRELNVRLGIGIGIFQGASTLFLNGIVLGVMYTGGKLIAAQRLSSGDLMTFLVASQAIQKSIGQMSLLFGQYVRGIGAGTKIFNYINLDPEVSEKCKFKNEIPKSLDGEIEFKNVTFSYPTRPQKIVLKDFSLKLPKGKMVAIVGASGSGKSTLANILEGFYQLKGGSVTIDDVPVNDLNLKWLRGEAIGLINQEPILFATSIMENIRYGKPSATDEEVFEAARQANAFEFIMDFPKGFNTKLGERGVTVSGGQKQRIAIARALIKKPKILILDEATSALDADSEHIVQKALDHAVQGRTVLVIAHRLSTVKKADMIAVMSNGAIVEMGTHPDLMKMKGYYYSLNKQQEFFTKPK